MQRSGVTKGDTGIREVPARYVDLVDGGRSSERYICQHLGMAWMGDIPLGPNYRLAIHIAVLGSMEFDASNNGHLRRGLRGVEIS